MTKDSPKFKEPDLDALVRSFALCLRSQSQHAANLFVCQEGLPSVFQAAAQEAVHRLYLAIDSFECTLQSAVTQAEVSEDLIPLERPTALEVMQIKKGIVPFEDCDKAVEPVRAAVNGEGLHGCTVSNGLDMQLNGTVTVSGVPRKEGEEIFDSQKCLSDAGKPFLPMVVDGLSPITRGSGTMCSTPMSTDMDRCGSHSPPQPVEQQDAKATMPVEERHVKRMSTIQSVSSQACSMASSFAPSLSLEQSHAISELPLDGAEQCRSPPEEMAEMSLEEWAQSAGRLGIDVFGGEDDDEEANQKCIAGVLNPQWTLRLAWDFLVILLVLIDAMVLPFQMAYKQSDGPDGFDEIWLWLTTALFGCDMVLSFNTAYEAGPNELGFQPGKLVPLRGRIARHYMRSWFPIDLVSTVPFGKLTDALTGGGAGSNSAQVVKLTKILKLVRFLRLMRMLRLAKLAVIWERIEAKMGSLILLQTIALLRVLFVLVAICHWNACMWWIIGQPKVAMIHELLSESAQTEWENMHHWTTLTRHAGGDLGSYRWIDRDISEAYLFCFYWTLGVMRTMPSEVHPVNKAERIYIMIFMFFAFSAFAVTITLITQTFFKISERKRGFNDDMAAVRTHLRATHLPEGTQLRIKGYLKHLYERRKIHAKEVAMYKVLPRTLQEQLTHGKLGCHLGKLKLLADLPDAALCLVTQILEQMDVAQGEAIAHEGQVAECAWVLIAGKLGAANEMGWQDHTVPSMEVVDEECLATRDKVLSERTIFASICAEVLKISKRKFFGMLSDNPVLEQHLMSHRELGAGDRVADGGRRSRSSYRKRQRGSTMPGRPTRQTCSHKEDVSSVDMIAAIVAS